MGRNSKVSVENPRNVAVQVRQNLKDAQNLRENKESFVGQKRFVRASPHKEVPNAKRSALGDLTNNVAGKRAGPVKPTKRESLTHRPVTRSMSDKKDQEKEPVEQKSVASITPLQQSLEATKIHDTSLQVAKEPGEVSKVQEWVDIDEPERNNSSYATEYATNVYQYMYKREEDFSLPANILSRQKDVTPEMRTILIDWLVELQENFELYHETLYLTVKMVDHYLNKKEVKREYLQLIGATAMLIASKFEELSPPLIDDFVYLCDDAYTSSELKRSERDMLQVIGYDINIPIAYRFLRRYAKAANASFETHTLARFICESSLQVYEFVSEKASLVAAAAMYLALRMKNLGGWTPTLQHYTRLSVRDLLPMAERLTRMLKTPWKSHHTVRTKYSHVVFHEVAKIPPLQDVKADAMSTGQL
jgi:cyclin B